jgi:hypothetical protein
VLSFQEKFCDQYGVPRELYGATVLRLTLYPHVQWLAGLGTRRFFAADHRFVAGVGKLTRWRDFASEVQEFQRDPQNRLFWRRRLRVRVSVGRMRVLFSEVWGGTAPDAERESRRSDFSRNDPGSPVLD